MTAGAGSDVASHGYGRAWVDLGPGNDQAEHLSGKFTGFGGAGNDTFRILTKYGTGLTARIDCGRGYDTLPVAYPHRKNCEKILYPNRPVNNPS